jgi:hypothetical protein
MARNRVIYQSEALYVSEDIESTGSNKHEQLERIQSANYSFTINRQDINQFGQAARIDSIVMDAPTVNLDFSYYLTDGFNERALGFHVETGDGAGDTGQFASGHMTYGVGKNLYITTVGEGADAKGSSGQDLKSVIGLGNAFLSDYTLDLSVGSIPTVSVSMECANINSTHDTVLSGEAGGYSGILTPAVDITDGKMIKDGTDDRTAVLPQFSQGESDIFALRPGDIEIDITGISGSTMSNITGKDSEDSIHIQSASLSIPLSRSPLQRLGTRFAYARPVDFPVNATLSINAICTDVVARNLSETLDATGAANDLLLKLKSTDSGGTQTDRMIYTLKGCRLDSESFSLSVGSNKSVDLTFSTQIGGVNDTGNGVFVSGENNDPIFPAA